MNFLNAFVISEKLNIKVRQVLEAAKEYRKLNGNYKNVFPTHAFSLSNSACFNKLSKGKRNIITREAFLTQNFSTRFTLSKYTVSFLVGYSFKRLLVQLLYFIMGLCSLSVNEASEGNGCESSVLHSRLKINIINMH